MKTILSLTLLALLVACGGDDGQDDPTASIDPVTCTPTGCAK